MNFEEFFESIADSNISVKVNDEFAKDAKHICQTSRSGQLKTSETHLLSNEALFQLPLICLIILLMAKSKRKPLVSEIGQLVGECIEQSMPGFKGSSQHIGWSANLRVRTVKAISFLENANLVEISNRKSRLAITKMGKKVIDTALKNEDTLAYNLAQISRSYRNICVSKQLDMELE